MIPIADKWKLDILFVFFIVGDIVDDFLNNVFAFGDKSCHWGSQVHQKADLDRFNLVSFVELNTAKGVLLTLMPCPIETIIFFFCVMGQIAKVITTWIFLYVIRIWHLEFVIIPILLTQHHIIPLFWIRIIRLIGVPRPTALLLR